MKATRLPLLAERARQHWKEFLPEMYKELQELGELNQRLLEAEQMTQDELTELENQGWMSNEAREIVYPKYLFLKPTKEEEFQSNPSLDSFWEAQKLVAEAHRLISNPDEE